MDSTALVWLLLLLIVVLVARPFFAKRKGAPPTLGSDVSHAVGALAASDLTTLHHVVAIGREAQATDSWQFVMRVEIGEVPGQYTTFRTIMSKEEQQVVANVVQRAAREGPKA